MRLIVVIALLSIILMQAVVPTEKNSAIIAYLGRPLLIKVKASTSYKNPLNTSQVNVTAVFNSSSGSIVLPCYPYSNGVWAVRFTPLSQYPYQFTISLRNSSGTYSLDSGRLQAIFNGSQMDFASAHGHYFYSGDRPLVLIGEDVAWASAPGNGKGGWEYYVEKLADDGGNWVRLWSPYATGGFSANYSALFSFAMERGVYVQFCLFSPYANQSFSEGPEWGSVNPTQFFGSRKMIALEKFWIRSLIGRYAAFPDLFAWELFNEIDGFPGYSPAQAANWTNLIAAYIEENDPYHHMVTVSVANPQNGDLFASKSISFAQLHLYGAGPYSVAPEICNWVKDYQIFNKPVLVAEFGASYLGPVNDPLGVSLQLGLWSALVAGSPATAMTWWWTFTINFSP